ncbi:hypothetical protein DMB44_07310 [Thermoplasma sp. Kam2015]|nr:hypothetical protein DMB44_07310 [Thermoplasma sp. Kam2015]
MQNRSIFIFQLSSILLFFLAFAIFYNRYIFITSDSLYLSFLILFIPAFLFLSTEALSKFFNSIGIYTETFYMFFLFVILFSFYGYPMFWILLLSAVPAAVSYWKMLDDSKGILIRLPAFIGTIIFMIYLGGLISIPLPTQAPVIIESDVSVFKGLGMIPLGLDIDGVFILSQNLDILISPFIEIVFFAVASLVSENYYQIISYSSRHGNTIGSALSGLTSAFSCQCESFISLLPAVAALIIDVILIPVLFLSLTLLILTYIFVSRYYKSGRRIRKFFVVPNRGSYIHTLMLVAGSVLLPVILEYLVSLGLEKNFIFFFMGGMAMVLSGFIFVLMVLDFIDFSFRSRLVGSMLSLSGLALSYVWFLPSLTYKAYSVPAYYALMMITGYLSGIAIGSGYHVMPDRMKYTYLEYVTVIFNVIPLIIFYMSAILEIHIWKFMPILDQVWFSLALWIFMLPLMWYTTHLSLNSFAGSDAFIAKQVIAHEHPD